MNQSQAFAEGEEEDGGVGELGAQLLEAVGEQGLDGVDGDVEGIGHLFRDIQEIV